MATNVSCSKCINMLVCATLGHVECGARLLGNGADVNYGGKKRTELPVHHAANNGFTDMLKLLVENGADINAQNKKQRNTPLHRASRQGKVDCVKWLLSNGAVPSLQIENKDGETPLAALLSPKATLKPDVKERVHLVLMAAAGDGGVSTGGDDAGDGSTRGKPAVLSLEIQAAPALTVDEDVGDWSCAKSPNWVRLQGQLEDTLGFSGTDQGEGGDPQLQSSTMQDAVDLGLGAVEKKEKNRKAELMPDFMGAISNINDGLQSNRLLAPLRKAVGKKALAPARKAAAGKSKLPGVTGKLGKRAKRKTAGGLQKRKQKKQKMKR